MAKEWAGKSYDEDFFEVDGTGQRVTGEKDWAAHDAYYAKNPRQVAPPATAPPAQTVESERLSKNVQDSINKALEQGPVVDENDPTYQAQDQANRIQSQRASENARMSAVQRMHAQGMGDSGGMDSRIRSIEQQRGEHDQSMNAQLRMNFLQDARQRVMQALQLGAGIMTGREEQALRMKLAEIQAQLAREDLAFRRDFSYDQLGQNLGLSLADLQQRAMGTMFGF